MKFSGNIALLKNQAREIDLQAGENIQVENDTISTVHIPTFGDVLLDSEDKLITELLDEKYNKQPNLELAPNSISLNLGSVNGLQVPTSSTQAANKKYVDDTLTYFWEQLQNFNYLNFKGEYNSQLTYKTGDLVISDNFFYLSLIDLNNEPLTNGNAWTKMSSALNGDLVTQDQLKQSLTIILNELNNKFSEIDTKLNDLMTKYEILDDYVTSHQVSLSYLEQIYYLEINFYNSSSTGKLGGYTFNLRNYEGNNIIPSSGSVFISSKRGYINGGRISANYSNEYSWPKNKSFVDINYPTSENAEDSFNSILMECSIVINGLLYRAAHFWFTTPYNFDYIQSNSTRHYSIRIPLLKEESQ